MAKEELLALELSPDYRHECGICDRDYTLRRVAPRVPVLKRLWSRAVGTRLRLGEATGLVCRGLAPKADGATNGG